MYDTHPSLRCVKEMRLLHALPSDLRASVVKLHAGTKEAQDDRQQICINGIVSDADYGRDLYSTVKGAEKEPTRRCVSNTPAGAYIVAAAVLRVLSTRLSDRPRISFVNLRLFSPQCPLHEPCITIMLLSASLKRIWRD